MRKSKSKRMLSAMKFANIAPAKIIGSHAANFSLFTFSFSLIAHIPTTATMIVSNKRFPTTRYNPSYAVEK